MTKEYCKECDCELNTNYDESEICQDCGKVYYCTNCAKMAKKYEPYILMCQNCEESYNDSMRDYDESAEREAIGDREGGYDQYDNRNEW